MEYANGTTLTTALCALVGQLKETSLTTLKELPDWMDVGTPHVHLLQDRKLHSVRVSDMLLDREKRFENIVRT